MNSIEIVPAYGELAELRRLFEEYAAWLGIDLSFQGYGEELAGLPGKYGLPDGRLYLAKVEGEVAGCVGLRRFDRLRCEMKRLFVRKRFRGLGLAGLLAGRVVRDASELGYTSMLLDTMSGMEAAIGLYRKMGFQEIPPPSQISSILKKN